MGETDSEYDFITKEECDALGNEVMQSVKFGDNYYGTRRSDLVKIFDEGKTAICIVEPGGVSVFKNQSSKMPAGYEFDVSVFYVAADKETLMKRWLERAAEDPNSIPSMGKRVISTITEETKWDSVLENSTNRPRRCFYDNSGGEEVIQLIASTIDMEMEWHRRFQRRFG